MLQTLNKQAFLCSTFEINRLFYAQHSKQTGFLSQSEHAKLPDYMDVKIQFL